MNGNINPPRKSHVYHNVIAVSRMTNSSEEARVMFPFEANVSSVEEVELVTDENGICDLHMAPDYDNDEIEG